METDGEAGLPLSEKSFLAISLVVIVFTMTVLMLMPAKTTGAVAKSQPGAGLAEKASPTAAPLPEYLIAISTDNYSYHPRDRVGLSINITVPESMELADIRFFGVENKNGEYKLSREMEMNLTQGLNVIETDTNIPSCSKCSGIDTPGVFQIYAALYRDDEQLANASKEIAILA